MKRFITIVLAVGMLLAFASCASYTPQVSLPSYITKIAIPVFTNKTSTYNIEQYLTQKVVDQFISDGKLTVTDELNADAVLKVSIDQYVNMAIVHDVNNIPQQYLLKIAITISFFDVKNQREIWNESDLWEQTTYYVVNNMGMPAETEEIARQRVLDALAGWIFRRVVNGW
jgi:hypothetical protein